MNFHYQLGRDILFDIVLKIEKRARKTGPQTEKQGITETMNRIAQMQASKLRQIQIIEFYLMRSNRKSIEEGSFKVKLSHPTIEREKPQLIGFLKKNEGEKKEI